MGCNCIPNGQVEVSNIIDAGKAPIEQKVVPKLNDIYTQLCWWAAPEYGDTGENWEKTLWKAALIGIATINTVAQLQIANQRYKLARDYADLAQDRWNRFRNAYAPFERAMMNEAGNLRKYDPNYPEALTRATENTDAAFLAADDQFTDRAKRYALCIDQTLLDDMDFAEAIAADDGANYNYRMEEYWHYYIADRNWNRRSELLNLGRGIQAIAASYATAANEALTSVGDLVNAGSQGAMKLFGYLSTVNETRYPAQFSSAAPLTGQASMFGSSLIMGPVGSM